MWGFDLFCGMAVGWGEGEVVVVVVVVVILVVWDSACRGGSRLESGGIGWGRGGVLCRVELID